jgi:Bacterial aa3 type cytochrome c oxidase subunit IV
MADKTPAGPVELGAQMDYGEHDKSYRLFVTLAKYCSLVVAAIMISLAFLFVAHGSIFASAVLFIVICAVGYYLLRDLPGHIT